MRARRRRAPRGRPRSAVAAGDVPRAADERVHLADPARDGAVDQDARRDLPGWRNGSAGRRHLDLGAELARQRLERALEREEVASGRLLRSRQRDRAAQRPDGERADAVRLVGGRGAVAREGSGERRPRRGLALREVGAARLEHRDALGAVGEVVAGGVEQRAEQRRAQLGVLDRERVGDADRGGARVAVAEAQARRHLGVGEAERGERVEAEVAHHVLGAAAQGLVAAQAAGLAGGRGERRRAGARRSRGSARPPRRGRSRG